LFIYIPSIHQLTGELLQGPIQGFVPNGYLKMSLNWAPGGRSKAETWPDSPLVSLDPPVRRNANERWALSGTSGNHLPDDARVRDPEARSEMLRNKHQGGCHWGGGEGKDRISFALWELLLCLNLYQACLSDPELAFLSFWRLFLAVCIYQKRHLCIENLFENTLGSFKYKLSAAKRSTGAG